MAAGTSLWLTHILGVHKTVSTPQAMWHSRTMKGPPTPYCWRRSSIVTPDVSTQPLSSPASEKINGSAARKKKLDFKKKKEKTPIATYCLKA